MTKMPAVLQWLLVAFLVVRRDVAAAEIRRRPNILLLITDDQDCLGGGRSHATPEQVPCQRRRVLFKNVCSYANMLSQSLLHFLGKVSS